MRKKKLKLKEWQKTTLLVFAMAIWVFCSVVASQFLVGMLLVLLVGGERLVQPVYAGIYSVLSYGLAILLTFVILPKIIRQKNPSREELGLMGMPTWTDIGLSPIAFVMSTVLAAALVTLFSLFPWFNADEVQQTGFTVMMNGGEKVIGFMVLVILAPIAEELIFRGWLYGKLRARVNMPLAILVTSVLFGLMHFQWNVAVNVFALSVVLCGLREITGTIYAGILTHMIKNGVAFYLLYVLGM